jgi:ABC-2 type transport system ATP-binding protein
MTDVSVRYGGRPAIRGVTLDVPAGAVTAVVGGDGAGKTTTLKVGSGVVVPDEGTVRHPPRDRIGAALEVPGVYRDLTVDENLRFVADAYGVGAKAAEARAAQLLTRAGLADARARLAGQLSGGMRQKLAVVLALLHQPDLLILDEPTTGVDPVSRAELWRLIGHAAAEGAAVLLATSYLDEAERAAHVLVLVDGRTLLQGPPEELTREGLLGLEQAVVDAQTAVAAGSAA